MNCVHSKQRIECHLAVSSSTLFCNIIDVRCALCKLISTLFPPQKWTIVYSSRAIQTLHVILGLLRHYMLQILIKMSIHFMPSDFTYLWWLLQVQRWKKWAILGEEFLFWHCRASKIISGRLVQVMKSRLSNLFTCLCG